MTAMQCRVLLFGQLAETVGKAEMTLDLPRGACASDALDALSELHHVIAASRDRIAVAVDESYAAAGTSLNDGCTIALIPPVSGG